MVLRLGVFFDAGVVVTGALATKGTGATALGAKEEKPGGLFCSTPYAAAA
jgi:hypothetical protein